MTSEKPAKSGFFSLAYGAQAYQGIRWQPHLAGGRHGGTRKPLHGTYPQDAMLTDTAIRNARPKAKPYKLTDERGLYLFVTPSGGKLW